jgi:hypothetical protein
MAGAVVQPLQDLPILPSFAPLLAIISHRHEEAMVRLGVFRIVEPNLAAGAIVVVDNVAHFPTELRPIVDRLSHAPYRATRLLLRSGTLVSVFARAAHKRGEP